MGLMGDHLFTVYPDYDGYLNVTPQNVLDRTSKRNQRVNIGVDGSEEVITLDNGKRYFIVRLQYEIISGSERAIIFDMFNDNTKADGIANTFLWNYPGDTTYNYVVKFIDPSLGDQLGTGDSCGINSFDLKVLGIF